MEEMTVEEQKQVAIDQYIILLRIKAGEKAENKVLEQEIEIAKVKLSTFAVDLNSIEKIFSA